MIPKFLLKLYSTNKAAVNRYLTAVLVGGITWGLSKIGCNLSEESSIQLAVAVGGFVNILISEVVIRTTSNRSLEAQNIINQAQSPAISSVKPDGWIHDQTLGSLKELVAAANLLTREEPERGMRERIVTEAEKL